MVNYIVDLYKTTKEAETAIEAIATTVAIQVVPVTDPKAGPCIMVIRTA